MSRTFSSFLGDRSALSCEHLNGLYFNLIYWNNECAAYSTILDGFGIHTPKKFYLRPWNTNLRKTEFNPLKKSNHTLEVRLPTRGNREIASLNIFQWHYESGANVLVVGQKYKVQWFCSTQKISAGCGPARGFLLSLFNIYINLPWRCLGWVSIIEQIQVTQIRKYLTFWTNGKKLIKMFLTKYFVSHACNKVRDLTNKNF